VCLQICKVVSLSQVPCNDVLLSNMINLMHVFHCSDDGEDEGSSPSSSSDEDDSFDDDDDEEDYLYSDSS